MARKTYSQAIDVPGDDLLAMLISGENEDGTSWYLGGDLTLERSTEFEDSHSIASAKTIHSYEVFNKGSNTLYLFGYDATSAPSNGTGPELAPVKLEAGDTVSVQLDRYKTTTGFTLAVSSTANTITIDTNDDCFFNIWHY